MLQSLCSASFLLVGLSHMVIVQLRKVTIMFRPGMVSAGNIHLRWGMKGYTWSATMFAIAKEVPLE